MGIRDGGEKESAEYTIKGVLCNRCFDGAVGGVVCFSPSRDKSRVVYQLVSNTAGGRFDILIAKGRAGDCREDCPRTERMRLMDRGVSKSRIPVFNQGLDLKIQK